MAVVVIIWSCYRLKKTEQLYQQQTVGQVLGPDDKRGIPKPNRLTSGLDNISPTPMGAAAEPSEPASEQYNSDDEV